MSIFSHVKIRKNKRRNFNLSHEAKLTADMGDLIPLYWNYFEPTSVFRFRPEIMCRVAPMLAPLMHRVNVQFAVYRIPLRLTMTDFEDFITGGPNGTSSPVFPYLRVGQERNHLLYSGSLADYLGVPYNGLGTYEFDIAPFIAYQLIYNEYFRDQNLSPDLTDYLELSKRSGLHTGQSEDYLLQLRKVCWEKDYFTSALPFAQRGNPVNIPVSGGNVQINYTNSQFPFGTIIRGANGNIDLTSDIGSLVSVTSTNTPVGGQVEEGLLRTGSASSSSTNYLNVDNSNNLSGSITSLNATINDLRTAQRVQRWLERNAVGGARYIEQILAHFPGARNLDARLQRPEYIGGGKIPLVVSEVLQTSEATEASAQGTMSGRGVAMGTGANITCKMDEHCIVMALMWIRPKSAYQQGMPRKLRIRDKFDFPWPEFGNLGEQVVENQEIFYTPNPSDDDNPNEGTFGYQSRYAQYKFEPNRVHGAFKDTLSFWHLGRIFSSLPSLNDDFVKLNDSNLNRIFAVENDGVLAQDLNHFWFQIYNNIKVNRPLPYFGTPL